MELDIQLSFKQRACTKLSSWRLGHLGNPTVGLARLVNWSRDPELGYSRSRNATRYAALGLNKRGVSFHFSHARDRDEVAMAYCPYYEGQSQTINR